MGFQNRVLIILSSNIRLYFQILDSFWCPSFSFFFFLNLLHGATAFAEFDPEESKHMLKEKNGMRFMNPIISSPSQLQAVIKSVTSALLIHLFSYLIAQLNTSLSPERQHFIQAKEQHKPLLFFVQGQGHVKEKNTNTR